MSFELVTYTNTYTSYTHRNTHLCACVYIQGNGEKHNFHDIMRHGTALIDEN